MTRRQQPAVLYGAFAVLWPLLAIRPFDPPTRLLENTLVLAGLGGLIAILSIYFRNRGALSRRRDRVQP
jgi:hypothetical protein